MFANTLASSHPGYDLLVLAGAVFALILTVLWILVPFALFGIKPLLRQILAEQRRGNELVAARIAATAPQVVVTEARDPRDPRDPRVETYPR